MYDNERYMYGSHCSIAIAQKERQLLSQSKQGNVSITRISYNQDLFCNAQLFSALSNHELTPHTRWFYIRLECLLLSDFYQNHRVFSTLQLYSTPDRVAPGIWSILATTPSLVRLPVDVLELFVGGC